ncbi:predicted protein [Sclerotinia sclerotiorum 1980 UF-70]|uniref:Uncharacterized protein n=1 Tax=Sclerotinia sclerotiorum (strain ATCC 18683 / 1980 / Ss-1) TaxID=665079 RepID=A7ELF5_SCLS1|nr:predicted protein [Sclerotinia sclerotiorum 1980 UF-70]EDO03671.1 predicted protein [Sclerotinia sclerotiorum 1980 UF-70]
MTLRSPALTHLLYRRAICSGWAAFNAEIVQYSSLGCVAKSGWRQPHSHTATGQLRIYRIRVIMTL